MSASENRELIGRYLQALSGQTKPASIVAQYVADPVLAEHIGRTEAAFPMYEIIADELIAERDIVAVRARFEGTQGADFAGVPASGQTVSVPCMLFYRVAGGRIVEHWMQFDMAELIKQLQQPAAAGR